MGGRCAAIVVHADALAGGAGLVRRPRLPLALTLAVEGLDGPNGLVFSPDGATLCVTETGAQFAPRPTHAVRAFSHVDGQTGTMTAVSGRVLGAVPAGAADGIACDEASRV